MRASVVIPTYNRIERLKRVLAAFSRQTYPFDGFEVVVVSDGSTDSTDDYLRSAQLPFSLRPLFQANQGVAVARNRGVESAVGKTVLFVDDDVVPAPELVAQHLRWHEAEDDDIVVLGPMLAPPDFQMSPWVRWEQTLLARQYQAMVDGEWQPTPRQFYTGNASLSRKHVLAAGGFDSSFRRAEDVELAYRLARRGMRFVFDPDAVGWHYAERSFGSWLSVPYQYGRNDVIFTRDLGTSWLLPAILREFRGRHPLVRGLAWASLDGKARSGLAISLLRLAIALGGRLNAPALQRFACSGLFNLRHAQGVADELGGRRTFYQALRRASA